jgi:hypothetical protein
VEALKLMCGIHRRLPSSEVCALEFYLYLFLLCLGYCIYSTDQEEFMLPDNKELQMSIITDALSTICLVRIHDTPFYQHLKSLIPYLLAKEKVFQAYLEGKEDWDLDSWNVLSDQMTTSSLTGMVQSGKLTLLHVGLQLMSLKM